MKQTNWARAGSARNQGVDPEMGVLAQGDDAPRKVRHTSSRRERLFRGGNPRIEEIAQHQLVKTSTTIAARQTTIVTFRNRQ